MNVLEITLKISKSMKFCRTIYLYGRLNMQTKQASLLVLCCKGNIPYRIRKRERFMR